MYKTTLRQIAFFIIFVAQSIAPSPANAMTAEEILKFMGVIGRYADDINRTFRPNFSPNIPPQLDPNSQPNLPQPNSQPTQPNPNPTIDRLLEQFIPRQ